MKGLSEYVAVLSEILEPYEAEVKRKLLDLATRHYDSDVAQISIELRGYFPDDFPLIIYFWDAENTQISATGAPEGYELLVSELAMADSEASEARLESIRKLTKSPDELEALAWHQWLKKLWLEVGVKSTVPIVADSYYTDVRTELAAGYHLPR
jgi:hypothetical protein